MKADRFYIEEENVAGCCEWCAIYVYHVYRADNYNEVATFPSYSEAEDFVASQAEVAQ